jgi:ABC-2 type transport system permease protein
MQLASTLRMLPLLVQMHVRSQMEYRAAFWLDRVAQIIAYSCAYGAIWLLLNRFHHLGGWVWPELALLVSFQLLGYSLGAALSFVQLRDLEDTVRLGTFDTLLVKPISPWAYLVFSGLNIGYVGHIILACGLMGWSLTQVSVEWTIGSVAYLIASLLSATLITAAIITMIGATALIWVRSNHLYAIFFGFWELSRFPLDIFPTAIQALLITVVPLGFTSAVPVAALLGKEVPLIGDWGGPAALLIGPVLALVAAMHWRYAISKYQGAGG